MNKDNVANIILLAIAVYILGGVLIGLFIEDSIFFLAGWAVCVIWVAGFILQNKKGNKE